MAPILIDKRDLLKLGFVSMLIIVTVFFGGVFLGYDRATTIYQAGNEVKVLSLPAKVVEASELETQHPEKMAAGETIDVDFPEPVTSSTTGSITNKQKAIKHKTIASSSSKPSVTQKKKDSQITAKAVDDDVVVTAFKKQPILFSSLTEDQINKVNFSIQVGMYVRLINAESMMDKLHEKNLDAYVSDYTNKEGETRYNVRIGYFADKKTAISSLNNYRNAEKGDGYLVNFSAESVVNIAETKNEKTPMLINEEKTTNIPGLNSAKVTFGNVTSTDVLSESQKIKKYYNELIVVR